MGRPTCLATRRGGSWNHAAPLDLFLRRDPGAAHCTGLAAGCAGRCFVFGTYGAAFNSDAPRCASAGHERFSAGAALGSTSAFGAFHGTPRESISSVDSRMEGLKQPHLRMALVCGHHLVLACPPALRSGTTRRSTSLCGTSGIFSDLHAFLVGVVSAHHTKAYPLWNGDPLSFYNGPAQRN